MEEKSHQGGRKRLSMTFEHGLISTRVYFIDLLHGSIPAVALVASDFLIKAIFSYSIGTKIRLIIFWFTTGNLKLGLSVGAVPIFNDIYDWIWHDGPDTPPMVTTDSLLHVIAYYIPTALIFFNVFRWWNALCSVLPALVIYFPIYLSYLSTISEITGLAKTARQLMSWVLLEVIDARAWAGLTLVLNFVGAKYNIRIAEPVCKPASVVFPWIEPRCSRLSLIKLVLLTSIPFIPVIIYGQILKIPYWTFLHSFRKGLQGDFCNIRLDQAEFEYKPLEPGCIRVLDVLPKSSSSGTYIRARIRHVRLEDADFDAISYTWGHPAKIRGILVNDKWLSVTENAFLVLGDRVSMMNTTTVWIDCISINQNDNQEKSSQVQMMSRIYQKANRTIVWLGDIPDAVRAFSLVSDLAERVTRRNDNEPQGYSIRTNDTIRLWLYDRYNKLDPRFESLARLLGHAYFRRVWIIQEIVFSKKVHLRSGTCWMDWSTFEWAVLLVLDSRFRRLVGGFHLIRQMENPAVLEQIKTIFSFRFDLNRSAITGRPALSSLLSDSSIAEATDQRDFIYGILSLCKEAEDPELVPDYTMDCTLVFKKIAAILLRKSELTDILYSAGIGHDRKLENLPSWIPDWTSRPAVNRLQKRNILTFNASAGHSRPIRACSSDGIAIYGVRFDMITALSCRPFPAENFKMDDSRWRSAALDILFTEIEMQRLADELADPYEPTGQSRQEAFWRTKILDRIKKPHVAGKSIFASTEAEPEAIGPRNYISSPSLAKWEKELSVMQTLISTLKSIGVTRDAFFNSNGEYDSSLALPPLQAMIKELSPATLTTLAKSFQSVQEYYEAMVYGCAGRCFAITERGYMALVPPLSRVGDQVCVLSGLDVPFILRRTTDSPLREYQLVGESYVHGIMFGKAWPDTAIEREFLIR